MGNKHAAINGIKTRWEQKINDPVRITIRLEREQWEQLGEIEGDRSSVVRQAIKEYLDRKN